jgi:hypothetical protein
MRTPIIRVPLLAVGLGAALALAGPAAASTGTASTGTASTGTASTGTAGAAGTKTVTFGSCQNSGEFAACTASGSVDNPLSIEIHVTAVPGQKIFGNWALTCQKGKQGRSRHGDLPNRAPLVEPLHLPFKAPGSCVLASMAQLRKTGSIKVALTAVVPDPAAGG